MYKIHPDFDVFHPVGWEELQEIMDRPVVRTDGLLSPVIIDYYTLLKSGNNWFLKVRGTNGEGGVAPCSDRAEYLFLLLKRVLLLTLGEDARNLESILNKIYVTDINYKIQGLEYWELGDYVNGGLAIKDGRVRIPEGLGLGIDGALLKRPDMETVFELKRQG